MKRIFALLLLTCLLLGCFSACNIADPDPKDTVGSETESDTETESVSETESETETETTPEEKLEKVYLPQEEIPGERVEFSLLADIHVFLGNSFESYALFLNKETLTQTIDQIPVSDEPAISELRQIAETVDFEEYGVIAIHADCSISEDPFMPDELILQDTRWVFVFHSNGYNEVLDAVSEHTFFLKVMKTDLPSKELDTFICGYSRDPLPSTDPVFFRSYFEYR